jgi:hypothetical protein
MPKNHALEEREDHEALPGNSAQASQNVIEFVEKVKIGYNLGDGIPKISLVPDEEYLNEKIKEEIFRLFNKIETPEERKNLISELQESFANSAKDHKYISVPLWKHRAQTEESLGRRLTAPEWIQMHYGRTSDDGAWHPDGLSLSDIRADMQLYETYRKWIKKHPEDDLQLPQKPRERVADPVKTLERRRRQSLESYHRRKGV